eukprot:CAMPEP_0170422978 /NCGR_PEP_ID=MMETSP0117_2-20130122/36750_1 /TAXON_ID=400756 /ORGANISM="Durinskia baltica, Strain CSIRO CS-38" /LENGTH=71 /DNA_ID=CAMNT_0010681691 /DNA_START=132 /DNA_END=343 /DNA_ORIENTATION=+
MTTNPLLAGSALGDKPTTSQSMGRGSSEDYGTSFYSDSNSSAMTGSMVLRSMEENSDYGSNHDSSHIDFVP